jgi:hypothetical protein
LEIDTTTISPIDDRKAKICVKFTMTNEEHNRYLSWAFIGHAIFQGFIAVMMIGMMALFFSMPFDPGRGTPPPKELVGVMLAFMFVFYMAFALPSVIAAYGLRKKRKWARIASIVAGVVAAMNVPVGTAACVYSLWFFLGENWKEVYPEAAFEKDERAKALQLTHERETRWTGWQTDEKGEVTFDKVDPPNWR